MCYRVSINKLGPHIKISIRFTFLKFIDKPNLKSRQCSFHYSVDIQIALSFKSFKFYLVYIFLSQPPSLALESQYLGLAL